MATGIVPQVPQPATDFVPEVFGRLTTLDAHFIEVAGGKRKKCHMVRCECGQVKSVRRDNLISGSTKTCGTCGRSDAIRQSAIRHGMKGSPEYQAYRSMCDRCYNCRVDSYPDYGGRGIGVWDTWRGPGGFELWFAEIGPRPSAKHSQDRKNNDKDYEPGNVCWATLEEQANNKRNSRKIEYAGKTQTLAQWAREIGIPSDTLGHRLDNGWTTERALTQPLQVHTKRKRLDDNRD